MRVVDIIQKKRDGRENTAQEMEFLVQGGLQHSVPEYQLAAWLMAVFFRGLSPQELQSFTRILIDSGQVVDFADISAPKIDKHSTGGVGDKTSLILAPVVAAAGIAVPMMSGRGLGHTGGTLDKLESIPGFRTGLSLREFRETVGRHGLALIGQTAELAPADKMLYALRDVTGTVESVPLIVSSIISKKVAEGIDGLVLDVKTGCGAFMKNLEDSEELAARLVETGKSLGKRVVALITDMSQPLGCQVGNALEVREALATLAGRGPQDLTHLSLELSAHMLLLGGVASNIEEARSTAGKQIQNGGALQKFREIIEAQGGNPEVVENPNLLPSAPRVHEFFLRQSGYIAAVQADLIGKAAMVLGAGREDIESTIRPGVGIELMAKVGDPVDGSKTVARIHYEDSTQLKESLELMSAAYRVSKTRTPPPRLIQKVIL